jgi:hypothetical protein
MAEQRALPTDHEVRTYMYKLKGFRDSLTPTEQRMLDAVVVASFWAEESGDTHGYGIMPPHTIYDDGAGLPPIDMTPWGKVFGTM